MATHGREIERKFLVRIDALPPLPEPRRFVQGYLADRPTVRVRTSDDGTPNAHAWLTIKGPGVIDRVELEYEIPIADAHLLLDLASATLTKRRYLLEHAGKTWEVDALDGALAGLWLAEIELSAVDETFEPPPWLGREVSHDPRYSNGALARAGTPPIDDAPPT